MIIWTDTESTGLDERTGLLLEVALLATDDGLTPIDEGAAVVLAVDPAKARSLMDHDVVEMHERSGLLAALHTATRHRDAAEAALADYLDQYAPEAKHAPLAGSNVKFDRKWLDAHMPAVTDQVHYRDICVSSTKETCRRFFAGAYTTAPRKGYEHRAMGDLRESIAEYRHYLTAMGSTVLNSTVR